MKRLLALAAITTALALPATAHAEDATFNYGPSVTANGVTCKSVQGTLKLHNSVGQLLASITNYTHWCYHYGGALTALPDGHTATDTGLGWDVDSQGWHPSWYSSTHGQAQTLSTAHFSLSVPILGHLQTWSPSICIVVGAKGNARNC